MTNTSRTETSKKKDLLIFFGITFLLSWGVWLPGVFDRGETIGRFLTDQTLQHIGAYAPSLTGLVLAYILYGRQHFFELIKRTVKVRFPLKWYLLSIFTVPLIMGASYLPARFLWNVRPELPLMENPLLIFIFLPYILFLGGPLGEEIGWRGFALPRLFQRFSPFLSGVILGAIWAVWHLPQFFMEGTVQSGLPFFGYLLITLYNSLFITLLFIKTGGSVFSAILFHLFSNFSYALFPIFTEWMGQLSLFTVFTAVTLIMLWVFRKIMSSPGDYTELQKLQRKK